MVSAGCIWFRIVTSDGTGMCRVMKVWVPLDVGNSLFPKKITLFHGISLVGKRQVFIISNPKYSDTRTLNANTVEDHDVVQVLQL